MVGFVSEGERAIQVSISLKSRVLSQFDALSVKMAIDRSSLVEALMSYILDNKENENLMEEIKKRK